MKRTFAALVAVLSAGAAAAQTAGTNQSGSPLPAVTLGTSGTASLKGSPVQRLLTDGYEVKTGFADPAGGAYLVLQKATSAYMCHSNPTATCEKLN